MEKDFVFENRKREERQAEEKRILFQNLGISQEDLSRFLKDPERFSPETWALLQRRREELEQQIDAKIQEICQPQKKTQLKSPWMCGKCKSS